MLSDMNKILDIHDLKVTFPASQVCAVNGISIQVNKGEIIGIIGESGSGKSITAKSVIQLLPDTAKVRSGEILYKGKDVSSLKESDKAKIRGDEIAYLLQNPMASFNPVKKIGIPLIDAIKKQKKQLSKKAIREKAADMLRDVGLKDASEILDCYPHQLSGGMLQRAAIAVALAKEPTVLIADEPTTALDVSVQNKILDLLREINQKKGTSIILISHNINVVRQLCSRVYIMHDGEIVEYGETEKILAKPTQEYTKKLLRSVIDYDTPHIGKKCEVGKEEKPVLEIVDVCKSFQTGNGMKSVLDKVSFEIPKGHTIGLLGESGCGKTTLAKCLAGVIKPDSGKILYEGKSGIVGEDGWTEKIQLVMQDSFSSFDDKHTIEFAFREVLRCHGIDNTEEKISEVLKIVHLDSNILGRYPHEISGGQCQRANIARALLLDPEIIIWDEPVSAMDTTIQLQLLQLLKEIQCEKEMTYIFISHDLPVVKYFCDEVIVIQNGRVRKGTDSLSQLRRYYAEITG